MAIERSIIDAAARLRRTREPHVVATVVRVTGTAYRRPGARMLLTQFRWITGSVSGGSLDGDIASKAWSQTRNGEPVFVTYDSRMPHSADECDDVRAAFGLGCDGVVEVMLERAGTPGRVDPLEVADRCIQKQRRGAVVTVIRSEAPGIRPGMRVAVIDGSEAEGDRFDAALRAGMIADARAAVVTGESRHRTYRSDLGNVDVFVEAIVPPPRVFVFGTGHDAVPVVTMLKQVGWDVCVCTDDTRMSIRQRFTNADEILVGSHAELAARIDQSERAIALVMSHHYETDRANLGMLVATHCKYIGVLGARARTQRMLAELGLGIYTDTRIHAPVGLPIGADTPHEVALAIAAEIQSFIANTNVPVAQLISLRPSAEGSGPVAATSAAAASAGVAAAVAGGVSLGVLEAALAAEVDAAIANAIAAATPEEIATEVSAPLPRAS